MEKNPICFISHCPINVATILVLFLVGILARNTGVQADTFELRGGGIITGKLINDPASSVLKIRTNDGVDLEIASSKIKTSLVTPEHEKAYMSWLMGKEDTAELHRAVSLDCLNLSRDPKALSYAHKERAVELDPSNENWSAIGYSQDKLTGEWTRRDVLQKRKGMVSLPGNKWDTPQSKAIADFDKARLVETKKIEGLIDQHLRNLTQQGAMGAKAKEFFTTLVDPVAMKTIYNLDNRLAINKIYDLLQKDANRSDMYIDLLAKMPDNSANSVFVKIAMNFTNSQLVSQAIELLERTEASREYAFQQFLNVISNDKSPTGAIDRAGSNVQSFADKRAIPILIDRLVSILSKQTVIPNPVSQSSDGSVSGGFGGPKTVTTKALYNHSTVLSALRSLVDNANYEYNIPEWRIWYSNTFAKTNLNLRRDE